MLATLLLTAATTAPPFPDELVDAGRPQSVTVDQTNEDWHVTPGGSFQYSIPIDIPDGRRGMQPTLRLVYHSRAGNGIAGMGWSLIGLPVITRVNAGNGIAYGGSDTYAVSLHGWGVAPDLPLGSARLPSCARRSKALRKAFATKRIRSGDSRELRHPSWV
jgi:hypothetical protein